MLIFLPITPPKPMTPSKCRPFAEVTLAVKISILPFFLWSVALCATAETEKQGGKWETGVFIFQDTVTRIDFPVYYYLPTTFDKDTPVLVYMHGINREPESARNVLIPHAESKNLVILVPLFSAEHFPGDSYSQGNAYTWNAETRRWSSIPEEKWSHPVIERLFTEFQQRYSMSKQTAYYLCGQSAGGQFVHRFPLFVKESRAKLLVAANAGFYTLPDLQTSWPQGFRNTSWKAEDIHRYLAVPLVILLGENDTNEEDPNLSRSERSMLQGPHRFARGQYYYKMGTTAAQQEKCPFGWKIQTVPEAGHGIRGVADAMTTIVREHANRPEACLTE